MNTRLTVLFINLLTFIILLTSSNVVANNDGLHFIPRVTMGAVHHKYEGFQIDKVSDNLPFLGFGIKVNYGSIFADAYVSETTEGNDDNAFNTIDFKHKNHYVSIGYSISDFSIFASYRTDETNLERMENVPEESTTNHTQVDFKADGPFLGAEYNVQLNDSIKLGINAAYGWLEGAHYFATTTQEGSFAGTTSIKDGNGFILGINLGGNFFKGTSYNVSLDYYKHKMDLGDDLAFSFNPYVEETQLIFKLSLGYRF